MTGSSFNGDFDGDPLRRLAAISVHGKKKSEVKYKGLFDYRRSGLNKCGLKSQEMKYLCIIFRICRQFLASKATDFENRGQISHFLTFDAFDGL